MIEAVVAEVPVPASVLLPRLLDPRFTDRILTLLGERGKVSDPLLHNTVNPTSRRRASQTRRRLP